MAKAGLGKDSRAERAGERMKWGKDKKNNNKKNL